MVTRGRPRGFDRDDALYRAMRLFWERGYEATAIADLTEVMGIRSPSLYAAFGSKEQLFRETVAMYDELEGTPVCQALENGETACAAVEAMLRVNARQYTDPDKPTGCMIVTAATNCGPGNEAVGEFLAEQRRRQLDQLAARLDRGIEEGDVPAGTDTATVASFYGTFLHGLTIRARDGATREQLQRSVDLAMAAWPTLVGGVGEVGEVGRTVTEPAE